jgi:predicted peptidase
MAANTFVPLGKDPGSPYGYIMVKPETATEAVFALHGIGERGDGKTQLTYLERNGVAYANKNKPLPLTDLAIFCPQQNKYNSDGVEQKKFYWGTLIKFMLHIVKKHGLSNRVHITGLSMGAYSLTFLMEAIKKYPEALEGLEIASCLLLSGVGDWRNGNVYPPTKLWTVHGLRDNYTADFSRNLVNQYNSTIPKAPARFDGLEFFGHDAAIWNKVYADSNVWQWMLNS